MALDSLRAGELDRRIALQRASKTILPSGEEVEGWATVAVRWASARPLLGDERSAADQWVAREQTEFRVRWDSTIADLRPLDRVVFPAADAGSSPEVTRSLYDIFAVHEISRQVGLLIRAARVP